MDELAQLIAENPAIFDVSDVERERVYDDLMKLVVKTIKKRSRPKADRELRRALRLDAATKRAANEAEFQEWLAQLNAPLTDEERSRCIMSS